MKYTVTEALVKLKLTNKKISDATGSVMVGFAAAKGSNHVPAGYKNIQEYKDEIKKRLDSVNGLVQFRDKLKKALVASNASTVVAVGSKNMTVAEAIETKSSLIFKKGLLDKLVNDMKVHEREVLTRNNNIEGRADEYVTKVFQGVAQNESDRMESRKKFIENNTYVIFSHDDIKKTVENLKDEIDEFETNVDVALSVINAKTEVEITD